MAKSTERDSEAAQEEQRQDRFRVLDLSAVGLVFPVALLFGYFGGRAIGGWLGSPQTGALIGALVGIVAGFYNLFKMASRLAPKRSVSSVATAPATIEPEADAPEQDAYIEDDDSDLEDGDLESTDRDEA